MADKAWKAAERRVARRLNGQRIPVTGERHGADVVTPLLAVQVKKGRRRPAFLREWLDGICRAAKDGRVGMIVWADNRERTEDAIVLLRLSDFQQLHGTLPKEES